MGLDMYLSANHYISRYDNKGKMLSNKIGKALGLTDVEVGNVTINAAYWRKDNAIHAWFVENVQGGNDDCNEYDVSRDQLKELVELCKKVLENKDKASELLETRSGFFFGSTTYDEWYFQGLEDTIKQLTKALQLPEKWYFTYQASW